MKRLKTNLLIKYTLFIIITFISTSLYCQADSSVLSGRFRTIDSTLRSLELRIRAQDNYVNIVERTNQQLSQGISFSSAFISALGVLFAVGSIIAGMLLFRQSKEYEKRIEAAISGYDDVVNRFIEEKKLELNMMILNQESMKTSNSEHNLKIDQEIKQLSNFRDSLTEFNSGRKSSVLGKKRR